MFNMDNSFPLPEREFERIAHLSEFDLDYTSLRASFNDLTKLASRIAGADVSLLNLLDSYTQWTVASHGINITQMPREESVCQYTIMADSSFEVPDLTEDRRFKDKPYVAGEPRLKYYYGIPLKTKKGLNIGTLCLMNRETKTLSLEKVEFLQVIASEIANRLQALKFITNLQDSLDEVEETRKRLAHDIRGPLTGIIGLTEIIVEQGDSAQIEDVLEFVGLINKSGNSLLSLANEILASNGEMDEAIPAPSGEVTQLILKEKLDELYRPQALVKKIELVIGTESDSELIPFAKNKILLIVGNLISNAIRFSPTGGKVCVDFKLKIGTHNNILIIRVEDSVSGIMPEYLHILTIGGPHAPAALGGEHGNGLGLALVKYLVDSLLGEIDVRTEGKGGYTIEIKLPESKR